MEEEIVIGGCGTKGFCTATRSSVLNILFRMFTRIAFALACFPPASPPPLGVKNEKDGRLL